MYHFNGTAWVRLAAPTANSGAANFHGINTTSAQAHCSMSSPVSSSCKIYEDEKPQIQQPQQQQLTRSSKRAPLKQLFPRTPTPFKKAYAAAVQKGGQVEQLDLQKSPELFEDLQEIIFKDVILPPSKRSRRTACDQSSAMNDQATTSLPSSSYCQYRSRAPSDNILDTTSTPSKILNDSSFLMSPPFQTELPASEPVIAPSRVVRSIVQDFGANDFVEPAVPPKPLSVDWIRIACGKTPAQVDLTSMAKDYLRRSSLNDPSLL